MRYLDGAWDAEDPWIGSIVNAHTNLTEITLAMDLLWRNDIDPAKVVMGLGFYGRSKLIVALRGRYEKSLSLTDRLQIAPSRLYLE